MKIQKKEKAAIQEQQTQPHKAAKQSLQDFVQKRLWGQPQSIQDGFMLFYSRNADKYNGDFEQALFDFTRQR